MSSSAIYEQMRDRFLAALANTTLKMAILGLLEEVVPHGDFILKDGPHEKSAPWGCFELPVPPPMFNDLWSSSIS